jgi:FlaA1/EpsC-like NDP-sugar epimerase
MREKINFLTNSDVFSHLTNLKYIPRWVVLFFDVFICILSYYTAAFVSSSLNGSLSDEMYLSFFQRIGSVIGLQVIFFWLFHTYSGVLRYSSYVDAAKLLLAVSLNVALIAASNFMFIA